MKTLRILLADDHSLMRRGLKATLESMPGWEVCAEAHTGREAVAKASQLRPDVVVLDVCMPELNGIEATRQIRKASPRTEVLILSVHHSDHLIREVIDAGARGYIVKSDSDRDLVAAVESLSQRKPFFTAHATEMLLSGYAGESPAGNADAAISQRLTAREREIGAAARRRKNQQGGGRRAQYQRKDGGNSSRPYHAQTGVSFGRRDCALRGPQSDYRLIERATEILTAPRARRDGKTARGCGKRKIILYFRRENLCQTCYIIIPRRATGSLG
jgi:DNA-binding NarL/FixJ family response regulator